MIMLIYYIENDFYMATAFVAWLPPQQELPQKYLSNIFLFPHKRFYVNITYFSLSLSLSLSLFLSRSLNNFSIIATRLFVNKYLWGC